MEAEYEVKVLAILLAAAITTGTVGSPMVAEAATIVNTEIVESEDKIYKKYTYVKV